jgi:small neutral amino acid transporter SnatA (MarC family)
MTDAPGMPPPRRSIGPQPAHARQKEATMNRKTAIPLLAGVAGLLLFLGHAQAQPAADSIATSATSADALLSLILTFGPLWGGMAIVFGVASTVLKRNESTHWIAQGRVLAVVTALVGVGVAALKAHFAGAPWAGVLLTAVLGLFKLIDPNTVTPSPGEATPGMAPPQ